MYALTLVERAAEVGADLDRSLRELDALSGRSTTPMPDRRTNSRCSASPARRRRSGNRAPASGPLRRRGRCDRSGGGAGRSRRTATALQSRRRRGGEQDWVASPSRSSARCRERAGFWIVPSWHDVPADARSVIRLDPGWRSVPARIPTTRMCLRWIAEHAEQGGTGARARLRLRLRHPRDRRRAARRAPRRSRSTSTRRRSTATAPTRAPTAWRCRRRQPDDAGGRLGWSLANILATPLKLLAPMLARLLDAGRRLVLAGVLERQADELRALAPWLDARGRRQRRRLDPA